MLDRYTAYGWTKTAICRKWQVSLQTFRSLKKEPQKLNKPQRIQPNAITKEEKQKVITYALVHTELNHREMTYRMIDEDVVFMSCSSVYRILKENNLLQRRQIKDKPLKWNPHAQLTGPDEVWQTDLMVVDFKRRDYYSLSYFDYYRKRTYFNPSYTNHYRKAIITTPSSPILMIKKKGQRLRDF
jgi:hypothetical protein